MDIYFETSKKSNKYSVEIGTYGRIDFLQVRNIISSLIEGVFLRGFADRAVLLASGTGDFNADLNARDGEIDLLHSKFITHKCCDEYHKEFFVELAILKPAGVSRDLWGISFSADIFVLFSFDLYDRFAKGKMVSTQYYDFVRRKDSTFNDGEWAVWLEDYDGYPELNGYFVGDSIFNKFQAAVRQCSIEDEFDLIFSLDSDL